MKRVASAPAASARHHPQIVSAARGSLKPRRRNRWCRCAWSATNTFSRCFSRRATTNVVSTIGTATPAEEVDKVQDRDDRDERRRSAEPLGHCVHAYEGEREAVDPDAEPDGHGRGEDLAAELLPPAEAAEVVDRAHRDGDRRAE